MNKSTSWWLESIHTQNVLLLKFSGGPTGLLSALLMRQLGTSVSVIEPRPGPLQLGRADALNARTQQYLEVASVLGELRFKGIECDTSSTFGEGVFKSRQSHWWTGIEHCLHKHFLMIGQPEVEAALVRRLDTPIHYSDQATAITEDDQGVTVITDLGRKFHARYALGADGERSMVRNTLGISFTGTKPEMVWAVLDTFLDTDFPVCSEIITFQLHEQSRVSWIPRERGMARFYVLLDGEITQKKAEASIREHMKPHRVDFRKTEWFSSFEIKERIASTFVSKEGQGVFCWPAMLPMCTLCEWRPRLGIADAFALAWRVSLAVKADGQNSTTAGPLIRSYDTERRTIAQDVIDVAARLVRETMHTAEQYVSTIEGSAGYITGMGVAYDKIGSALVSDSEHGIWQAGRTCPDIVLSGAGGLRSRRLYSSITYGQFLILSCGSALVEAWSDMHDVCTRYTLLPVGQGPSDAGSDTEGKQWTFESEEVHADERFVVVVRPDMYLGYVGTEVGAFSYVSKTVRGI